MNEHHTLRIAANGMLILETSERYFRFRPDTVVTISPNKHRDGTGYFISCEGEKHYWVNLPYKEIVQTVDRALDIYLTEKAGYDVYE